MQLACPHQDAPQLFRTVSLQWSSSSHPGQSSARLGQSACLQRNWTLCVVYVGACNGDARTHPNTSSSNLGGIVYSTCEVLFRMRVPSVFVYHVCAIAMCLPLKQHPHVFLSQRGRGWNKQLVQRLVRFCTVVATARLCIDNSRW